MNALNATLVSTVAQRALSKKHSVRATRNQTGEHCSSCGGSPVFDILFLFIRLSKH